ncbi:MAG: protein kinase, partial [Polyangiales bacterium]
RDVSPHNLMVGYDGITKVLDFGIAKASLQEHATRTGLIKGKFAYIAPEQATGDELDRRADVWSAGVVLWEALAGRRLFKGKTEVGTLQEALTKPVPSLLEIHADVPRELAEVCDRALQRDADDRFATALAMKLAIDEWLASRSVRGSHEEVARVVGELFDAEHREQRKLLKALTRFSDVDREVMRDLGTLSTAVALPEGAVSISTSTSASRMTPASVSHVEVRGTPRPSPGPKIAIVAIFLVAAAVGAWFATAPSSSEEASEPIATGPREPVPADPPSGVPSGPTTREPAPEPSPGEPPTDPSATATNGPPTPPRNEPAAVDMQPRVVRRPTTARPRSTSAAPVSTTPTSPAPPRVEPAPEPTEFGFLTLDTNPWSIVSVGGRRLGNTPLVRARLPAGTHVLELSNPELDLRTTYTVVIEANQTYSRRIGIE